MKLKYTGKEERLVFLRKGETKVNKGDIFTVSQKELMKFKNKTDFKKVK